MNETLIRALSGFVYITVLISALFISQYTLFGILLIFGLISCWELNQIFKHKGITSYIHLLLIFCIVILHPENERKAQLLLFLSSISILINIYLGYRLFTLAPLKSSNFLTRILPITYLSIPIALLSLIPQIENTYTPSILLGIMVIIWANDTFAYLVGKNFGKRKLFEPISPKKTIEGFWGGLIFAGIAGLTMSFFCTKIPASHWFILSILIAIIGSIGDLVASKFKREANIKDSSNLIPGHGGFIDRLDSLLFVSSFVYLYLQILYYVS